MGLYTAHKNIPPLYFSKGISCTEQIKFRILWQQKVKGKKHLAY